MDLPLPDKAKPQAACGVQRNTEIPCFVHQFAAARSGAKLQRWAISQVFSPGVALADRLPSHDPMTPETSTVIAQIAQIVGWLPKREVAAGDVRSGLVVIQAHVTTGSLRRGDLLGFQAHVLRLKPSPLRTVLNRRVVQLVEDPAVAFDVAGNQS